MLFTDLQLASVQALSTLTLALWKILATSSPSHMRTSREDRFRSNTRSMVTFAFHSFDVFGTPSKERLFMADCFKWAPKGLGVWLFNRNKSPGMAKLRKNQAYTHEVAVKLLKEKRQEIKDGTSRKDLLSLLGLSSISFVERGRQ